MVRWYPPALLCRAVPQYGDSAHTHDFYRDACVCCGLPLEKIQWNGYQVLASRYVIHEEPF